MSCNPKELATVKLFELLDDDELNELAASIDSKNVTAGETLFNAGDFGESLERVQTSLDDGAGLDALARLRRAFSPT